MRARDLFVRPGIREWSSRIHVRSIVGRYLEHSRVFDFANGGEGETGLAARLDATNLSDRVEVLVPVRIADTRAHSPRILDALLQDNRKPVCCER